jgi:dienelactone hydrolase
MVFLTAVRHGGVDAAVWYHGGDIEKYLGEVDGLNAPLLMHLAEEDEFLSKAARAAIRAALAKNQMRRCTPTQGRTMPSLGITEHTATLLPQHSPTCGRGNF